MPPASNLKVGYREPALGGGAVYFRFYAGVRPAVLSDTNAELVDTFTVVRDEPEKLLEALARHQRAFEEAVRRHGYDGYKDTYLALRGILPGDLSLVERAARMIALNKTGLNGLYRVNAAGIFNVPPGKQERTDGSVRVPTLARADRLMATSRALHGTAIRRCDMRASLEDARPGELVYIDPPYIPISATASFTAYTANGFGYEDQCELAKAVTAAASRGVLVATSNSDTELSRSLYSRFHISTVVAPRSISVDGATRAPVTEILVRTWI